MNNSSQEETMNPHAAENETSTGNEKQENTSTEATNNETQNPLEEMKEALQEEKSKFLRLFAEFENYKKRTGKERLDLMKSANQSLLVDLLPVLDDFERGMEQITKSEDKNLVEGVQLIQHKLVETLKNKGLKTIEVAQGDFFDADTHEAVTQIPAPTEDMQGKIIDVVETGYELNGKIIRYPKVIVGK